VDPDAVWGGEWGRLRIGVLDGVDIVEGEGAVSGDEFGACHCNQWGLRCIVVQERRVLLKLL